MKKYLGDFQAIEPTSKGFEICFKYQLFSKSDETVWVEQKGYSFLTGILPRKGEELEAVKKFGPIAFDKAREEAFKRLEERKKPLFSF